MILRKLIDLQTV